MSDLDEILKQASYRRDGASVYGTPDMANSAVLVMNMQRAWVAEDGPFRGLRPGQSRGFFRQIAEFVDKAREKGARIVWCKTATEDKGSDGYWSTYLDNFVGADKRELACQSLLKGGEMQQMDPMFKLNVEDWIVEKPRFDAFLGTDLDPALREDQRSGVIAIGTATNICCESTIRSGMCRDFKTWMPNNLVSAPTEDGHLAGLRSVAQSFADIMTLSLS